MSHSLGSANGLRGLLGGHRSGRLGAHIYLVGIGGAGLSAIARILLERGYRVSGSDLAPGPITEPLRAMGADIFSGHAEEHIRDVDLLLVSSAVGQGNPEVAEALRRGVPVFKRPEFLGWLTEGYATVAVGGTHGKTTTTAMLAWILTQAGLDPSYIIGGVLSELGGNAHAGGGEHFVIEADEYDRTFLGLKPRVGVITTIEWDHVDCYPTPDDCYQAFGSFAALVASDGLLVYCADGDDVRALGKARRTAGLPSVSYALSHEADWQAVGLASNSIGGTSFEVQHQGRRRVVAELRIPGRHNVANALAALAVADYLTVNLETAAGALACFSGAERRFQVKGEISGVTVVDDYAHHPTEIRATLAAARERYVGRRIWAVFQPHTYSRTAALLGEFATSFVDADRVIVADIYAAREQDDGLVSAAELVKAMQHRNSLHLGDLREIAEYLADQLEPGDVLITLGAGNGYLVGEWVLAAIGERTNARGAGQDSG